MQCRCLGGFSCRHPDSLGIKEHIGGGPSHFIGANQPPGGIKRCGGDGGFPLAPAPVGASAARAAREGAHRVRVGGRSAVGAGGIAAGDAAREDGFAHDAATGGLEVVLHREASDPSTSTPARQSSTTPLQALYLLNDKFVHEQAEGMVRRLQADSSDESSRMNKCWLLMFGRLPDADEKSAAMEFLAETQKELESNGEELAILDQQSWQALVRSLFRLNEFVYVD